MPAHRFALFGLLCLLPLAADAAQPLFADHETLAVTIEAPLRAVQQERDSGEYHDGRLTVSDDAGTHTLDLKLRARGKYRRQEKTCSFPPIRLNFKKKQVEGTVFEGQDKLKLVTHCRSSRSDFEHYVLKEYLAYRILQVVTDRSFGVRLLRVAWRDSERPDENIEAYGFLIEDEERLGERLGLELADAGNVRPALLDPEQAALVAVFEFLIANTDFSLIAGPQGESCCHNVVLYRDGQNYVPIPYDFDFSGLVNAPYAEPHPRLNMRSVRTRRYRGRCDHVELISPSVERFRAARGEIMQLIDSLSGLEERDREGVRRFVEKFYDSTDSERRIESRLVKRCV